MAGLGDARHRTSLRRYHPKRGLSLAGFWPRTYGSHLTLLASADFKGQTVDPVPPPEPEEPTLTADRTQLRKDARAARATFVETISPAVRRALDEALADRLASVIAGARVVGAHAAHGSEIDVAPALTGLDGRLAWPRIAADGGLSFHCCDRADLVSGAHRVLEAPPGLPEALPDLLLVPLLLFDRRGTRLGQGGGHYDRTLARLRALGPVTAVGVAFDMQEADRLHAAPWDAPLDAIATPSRFHWCRPEASAAP